MIEIRTKDLEPHNAVFLKMVGPYAQMREAMAAVYGWIGSHGYTPSQPPSAVFLTDPAEVPEDQAVWEVRAPISDGIGPVEIDESGIGVMPVSATTVAYTVYEGPYTQMGETYDVLAEWIGANGFRLAGPPEEVYLNGPGEVSSPAEYLTEIRFPVVAA